MSLLPLQLGRMDVAGHTVQRSGVRWLCADGHRCRAGEVIAYCNIAVVPPGPRSDARPFAEEGRDFQVAFAPRVAGRLRKAADVSLGGFLDRLEYYQVWTPEFAIGQLECEEAAPGDYSQRDGPLETLMLAGRRMTELAEVRSGLLTGWHDRSRAWWGDGEATFGTLLSLGICDQVGVVRGERFAFTELFHATAGPAQAVFMPDDALVPCVPVLSEQLQRTPEQFEEILADFARTFGEGPHTPAPGDWIFAGSLLSALRRSPLRERYDMLTRSGLRKAGPADAVLLSLHSEAVHILRHKRLGYAVQCHVFRIAETGPAVRSWFKKNFDILTRTPETLLADYGEFADLVRASSNAHLLVMNAMSTSGREDLQSYAGFDAPLRDTLSSVRAKELNLMLHDLARAKDVAIVDVDAIAAEIGGMSHVPDGVHFSGPMQVAVRAEVLHIARSRGVPGFVPRGGAHDVAGA